MPSTVFVDAKIFSFFLSYFFQRFVWFSCWLVSCNSLSFEGNRKTNFRGKKSKTVSSNGSCLLQQRWKERNGLCVKCQNVCRTFTVIFGSRRFCSVLWQVNVKWSATKIWRNKMQRQKQIRRSTMLFINHFSVKCFSLKVHCTLSENKRNFDYANASFSCQARKRNQPKEMTEQKHFFSHFENFIFFLFRFVVLRWRQTTRIRQFISSSFFALS